jgi:hypothetical protein
MMSTKTKKSKSICSLPELHVRLVDDDHEQIIAMAKEQGISKAEIARRILHNAIATDAAESGLDIITAVLRKTLRSEFDGKFKELKDLEYKALSTAATAQFLLLKSMRYTMSSLNESEFRELYEAARKDAFNYVYRNGKAPDIGFDYMESDQESHKNNDYDYASILSKGFKPDA